MKNYNYTLHIINYFQTFFEGYQIILNDSQPYNNTGKEISKNRVIIEIDNIIPTYSESDSVNKIDVNFQAKLYLDLSKINSIPIMINFYQNLRTQGNTVKEGGNVIGKIVISDSFYNVGENESFWKINGSYFIYD